MNWPLIAASSVCPCWPEVGITRVSNDVTSATDAVRAGCRFCEHHRANIYSLISQSHLAVIYPFSSPAYIADFLDVPSIYYDPTQSVSRHDFADPPTLIDFANTPLTLRNAAVTALRKAFPGETVRH